MKRNKIPLLLLPLLAVLALPLLSLPAHAEETIGEEAIREAESELRSEKEEALASVNSLTFLAEEDKESYRIPLNEVYDNALAQIHSLTDIDEIFYCKENAVLNLSLKKQEAIHKNLGIGKETYLSLLCSRE